MVLVQTRGGGGGRRAELFLCSVGVHIAFQSSYTKWSASDRTLQYGYFHQKEVREKTFETFFVSFRPFVSPSTLSSRTLVLVSSASAPLSPPSLLPGYQISLP
jgi:hypothetical protein